MEVPVRIKLADTWMRHPVEESSFYHSVVDHVFEDNLVADLERFIE